MLKLKEKQYLIVNVNKPRNFCSYEVPVKSVLVTARSIPRNSRNWRNPRKIIISFLQTALELSLTYSDTFSQILSVKNNSNSIFLQFRVFVCGPIPKNENAEFAEGFKKFIKFTESVLDSGCTAQIDHLLPMFIYTADYFSNLLLSIWTFFQTKNWKMELRLPKWKQILAHVRNRPNVFK